MPRWEDRFLCGAHCSGRSCSPGVTCSRSKVMARDARWRRPVPDPGNSICPYNTCTSPHHWVLALQDLQNPRRPSPCHRQTIVNGEVPSGGHYLISAHPHLPSPLQWLAPYGPSWIISSPAVEPRCGAGMGASRWVGKDVGRWCFHLWLRQPSSAHHCSTASVLSS